MLPVKAEQQRRTPKRGREFSRPFALASWSALAAASAFGSGDSAGRRARSDAPYHGQMHANRGCAVLCAPYGCATLRLACLEPLQSEASDFARVLQVELVFNVRTVCLYGLWTEIQ